jgi:hypothetical protein
VLFPGGMMRRKSEVNPYLVKMTQTSDMDFYHFVRRELLYFLQEEMNLALDKNKKLGHPSEFMPAVDFSKQKDIFLNSEEEFSDKSNPLFSYRIKLMCVEVKLREFDVTSQEQRVELLKIIKCFMRMINIEHSTFSVGGVLQIDVVKKRFRTSIAEQYSAHSGDNQGKTSLLQVADRKESQSSQNSVQQNENPILRAKANAILDSMCDNNEDDVHRSGFLPSIRTKTRVHFFESRSDSSDMTKLPPINTPAKKQYP